MYLLFTFTHMVQFNIEIADMQTLPSPARQNNDCQQDEHDTPEHQCTFDYGHRKGDTVR